MKIIIENLPIPEIQGLKNGLANLNNTIVLINDMKAIYDVLSENEADLIGGVSIDDKDPLLAKTLLDLSQSATINDSLKLANFVLKEIKKVNNLHKKWPEQAGFAVLKAPDIPSILVEVAFLSNPKEEKQLKTAKFQKKLAKAIYLGTKKYIKSGVTITSTNDPDN